MKGGWDLICIMQYQRSLHVDFGLINVSRMTELLQIYTNDNIKLFTYTHCIACSSILLLSPSASIFFTR